MLKSELREIYRSKRAKFSREHLLAKSLEISNQLLLLPLWDYSYFHLFLNDEHSAEVDTTPILTLLQGRDKNIVVPRVKEPRDLEHFLLTDNTRLNTNRWGIPEPVEGIPIDPKKLDVVFIPLLVYDNQGNRLGYGKGFYDNFLKQCRPDCLKVGLSFFPPEKQHWPVEAHDVRLDFCVSPDKIYPFK